MMKKQILYIVNSFLLLFVYTYSHATNLNHIHKDTIIKVAKQVVKIKGTQISSIALTNYAGKKIGNMPTYFFYDSSKIIISFFLTNKVEGVYLVTIQEMYYETVKNKIVDVSFAKAFVDPEMNTSPKQYWNVGIDVRLPSNEVLEVGETTQYRNNGDRAVKEVFKGTSYLLPFATKQQANAFATKLTQLLKANVVN